MKRSKIYHNKTISDDLVDDYSDEILAKDAEEKIGVVKLVDVLTVPFLLLFLVAVTVGPMFIKIHLLCNIITYGSFAISVFLLMYGYAAARKTYDSYNIDTLYDAQAKMYRIKFIFI